MKKWISIFTGALILGVLVACLHGAGSNIHPNTSGAGKSDGVKISDDENSDRESEEDSFNPVNEDYSANDIDGSINPNEGKNEEEKIEEDSDSSDNDEIDEMKEEADKGEEQIDVDLTAISGLLVYSEVSNMMTRPGDYIGKTVKMRGLYAVAYDDRYDQYYDYCIVQDATACCANGIEFNLTDDYVKPDDYPSEGDEITVFGVFETYQEGGYTYCTLRNAKLIQ